MQNLKHIKWIIIAVLLMIAAVALIEVSSATIKVGDNTQSRREGVITITSPTGTVHRFRIDTAQTRQEQEKGLMYREQIADDYGMLFIYENVEQRYMWMKNTPSPLDMLFMDEKGKIVWIIENAKPYDEQVLSSHVPVKATLEIKGGQVAARGIKLGDSVQHRVFGELTDISRGQKF